MKNVIIDNLKRISRLKEYSDQDIVYFLVESYKLLEQENKLDDFNILKFYRNWSCHSRLDKDAHKIFEEIYIILRADEYLNLKRNDPIAFSYLIDNTVNKIFEKYSFKMLKKDIEIFSKFFLEREILKFQFFQRPLQNVIKDIPLIVTKNHIGKGEEIFRLEVREQVAGNC